MLDHFNSIAPKRGLSPVAATTDNTAYVSQIADMAGYRCAIFIILTGSLADADATFATTMDHGDVANLSDAAAVPAVDLLGTTALASFTFAADDKVFKIGYCGIKRYVRTTITPAANTGNVFIAGVWLMCKPRNMPSANPPA